MIAGSLPAAIWRDRISVIPESGKEKPRSHSCANSSSGVHGVARRIIAAQLPTRNLSQPLIFNIRGVFMQCYVGYVYVIKFSDGLVKAGRTASPKTRIKNGGYGNRVIADYWVSEKLSNSCIMERKILSAIKNISTSQVGREYFGGVEFIAAVEAAKRECDKASEMFEPHSIQEAIEKHKSVTTAIANTVLDASGRLSTKAQNEKIELGLTAIRSSVFYSCLGIRERLECFDNDIFWIELGKNDAERLDEILSGIDECKSALLLIARVMSAEFTGGEFAELYEYAAKSKEMLESIRTLSVEECRAMHQASENQGGAA